jgi:hypothetical protein
MAVNTTSQAQFGAPDRKHSRAQAAAGRRCREIDCPTVLSRYNSDEYCYLHLVPAFKHALQRP